MSLLCTICSSPVPPERAGRKGYSSVTCSDEHYAQVRKARKGRTRAYKFGAEERALLLRLRRANFTLAEFDIFARWWAGQRKAQRQASIGHTEAADTARHAITE